MQSLKSYPAVKVTGMPLQPISKNENIMDNITGQLLAYKPKDYFPVKALGILAV